MQPVEGEAFVGKRPVGGFGIGPKAAEGVEQAAKGRQVAPFFIEQKNQTNGEHEGQQGRNFFHAEGGAGCPENNNFGAPKLGGGDESF